ncbi:AbiJ-NTD4 domain-containing protein [Taibaiella soli]|uniref:HEPN AbiJ-N-terminal domain-containing protein n=1 Tax=Taibaiella soli TaxID=1649169 RepID=A0A2W2ASX1_9BACT|nr:hypothetical protein [Taibaiella soli]PZF70788.1 hypothetical protein DN068_21325 [Taibaiella soli]
MSFSQRMGITPATKEIQLESMDDDLRNGLWNIFKTKILNHLTLRNYTGSGLEEINYHIYHNFFKKPIDIHPGPTSENHTLWELQKFYFNANWYETYNFIEFSIELVCWLIDSDGFYEELDEVIESYNHVLKREFSGYRFIEDKICPISNEQEIASLNESINETGNYTALRGCNLHLKSALQKLSDRNNPDYRNSIKESISAVESLAKIISGGARDTLAASLDKIKGKLDIHPAMERSFKQLYGYTSDSGGIRHAMTEEGTNVDFEDAKFMLISCSAFINYLIVKAQKAGITFN